MLPFLSLPLSTDMRLLNCTGGYVARALGRLGASLGLEETLTSDNLNHTSILLGAKYMNEIIEC